MPEGFSSSDFYYLLPELVLAAGSLMLLVFDAIHWSLCGLLFGRVVED